MTVTLGIVGGTGSGKSTLARALSRRVGEDGVNLIEQDHYYRDLSHLPLPERAATNFDDPRALDLDLLAGHLAALRSGKPVERPEYDMRTHVRTGARVRLAPRGLVVAEGTLIATHAGVRAALDCLVFVDLDEAVRRARRIRRDVEERGRTEEEVRRRWREWVAPMHRLHIEPARAVADLVVPGDGDVGELVRRVEASLHWG